MPDIDWYDIKFLESAPNLKALIKLEFPNPIPILHSRHSRSVFGVTPDGIYWKKPRPLA